MLKRFTLIFALLGAVPLTFLLAVDALNNSDDELPELKRTSLMDQEARLIVEMLETMHYESAEITPETFKELIINFMEDLDYNKLYFLSEHKRNFLEEYGDDLGFKLRYQGELEAAFEIYSLYRDRALERIEWILSKLEDDWTFEIEEAYVYDRSESEWPDSNEEADELWRLRIKYELLQEVLNDKTLEEAKERVQTRYNRVVRSIHEFDSKDVQEIFLTSLTKMFDPHSSFLSSDTLEDFNIQMRLKLIGIGAMLSEEDGYCVIKELVPGAPAIRTKKLKPNDRIVAVQQDGEEPVDIIGMGLRKIVDKIRGEKGTTVTLTIIPSDAIDDSVRKNVEIVRDVVHINSSRCTGSVFEVPTEGNTSLPIGVIEIPSFYGGDEYFENGTRKITSVTADVEELVMKMKDAGVKGIVLDLRHNGGGLLDEAINMTGLFIRRGPVVQVKEKSGNTNPLMDRDPKVIYRGPLAVLTSRYSASASEIVAGALQNYGRSITIGNTSTHGKGTVQQVFSLDEYVLRRDLANDRAGAAKLTVRKFYLPNGFSTQRKGVVPDIHLESIEEITAVGEADLPNALSWDYINPVARFVEMTLKSSLVESLADLSSKRMDSLDEFQFLQKRIDFLQQREDRKEISLNLDTRKSMLETDEAFLDTMKEEQRQLADLMSFEEEIIKLESVIRDEEARAKEQAEQDAALAAAQEEEESSVEETEAEVAANKADETTSEEEDEEEELPDFDIQLREALRIMTDAIQIAPDPNDWSQPALPIASKTRFEKLIN